MNIIGIKSKLNSNIASMQHKWGWACLSVSYSPPKGISNQDLNVLSTINESYP